MLVCDERCRQEWREVDGPEEYALPREGSLLKLKGTNPKWEELL
jgi:hypothetical protein